jgi:membrane-associated phospholipid phosphatase
MALITIRPTKLDRAIADFAEKNATSAIEEALQLLTYAADEHVLIAASLGVWLLSLRMSPRRRRAAGYLMLNVAASAALPHILKSMVDQERPDRRVHGRRHGIPVSGQACDAFPSGHAVHIGAIASAVTRYFPGLKHVAWACGGGIAATRVLLLAHWTTDVLAGLALGATLERGLWAVWWQRLARR